MLMIFFAGKEVILIMRDSVTQAVIYSVASSFTQ